MASKSIMWTPEGFKRKLSMLVAITAVTIGIHYGWLVRPFFGEVPWIHAVHGRFCYIPIVIAAAWFGIRGGMLQAAAISILVIPYIFAHNLNSHELASEIAEIVFYFALAAIIGFLVEREFMARRRQQEAQLQVERSHKLSLVGQIAAGVAHEIKNPLASIKGAADILSDNGTSSSDRAEFSSILRDEIKRIDTTVTEFLGFARPKETKLRELNLAETVRTSARQLDAQARRSGVNLEVNTDDSPSVNGDPEKLHQLVLNLVLNAVQASPEGGTVTISVTRTDGGHAQLVVSDNGEGISDEDVRRVFEPFFTTRSSGTGLGLAIVRAIVDDHEGEIVIDSEQGRGTTVMVRLPILQTAR